MALVASALSSAGYKKVLDIMNGDEVLKNRGGGRTGGRQGAAGTPPAGTPPAGPPPAGAPAGRGRGSVQFGQDEYYIALLGTPSATTPWIIQFGGHHLAINVTVVGANNVLTPSLPAAQPAKYTLNGQTIRPLGNENDKGFALINALTPDQQKQAILNYKVSDLVLGPGNDGKVIQPEGIQGSALTPSQQSMLLDVAHEWVGILNDAAASAKMAELKSNLAQTWFAWSGDTKNGGLAYYRIQGPTVDHRVRAAAGRSRSHSHDLSGSDQRLRREARGTMIMRRVAISSAEYSSHAWRVRRAPTRTGSTSTCRRRAYRSTSIACP